MIHRQRPRREVVHENGYFRVVRSSFDSLSGPREYWSIDKADFVAVLAHDPRGRLALIQIFRPLIGREVLELPQGAIEADESAENAARRELREETGISVARLRRLGHIHESYGITSSLCHLYVAGVAQRGEAESGEGEDIRGVRFLTVRETWDRVAAGDITDSVTIAATGLFGSQ